VLATMVVVYADTNKLIAETKANLREIRVLKCQHIVKKLYPKSGFLPHVEYFIAQHEKYGIADEWQWSLAYGGANFGLKCNFRARNGCAGPMDRPRGSTNPRKNILAHVEETTRYHRNGYRGYKLMQVVFYPARPHDWGGGKIRKAYNKHVKCLEGYYNEQVER